MPRFHKLEDVEKAANDNPQSFFIPSAEERRNQKIGASVRLHFLLKETGPGEISAERIWVTITRVNGLLFGYRGKLETRPLLFEEFGMGDEISFNPRHIGQTLIKVGDPRWIECADKIAFVSKLCLAKGNCVRWLYRENPVRVDDSGWRVFSGSEPDGYTDDPKNTTTLVVGYLLAKDATLFEPFRASVGSAFERDGLKKPWRKVAKWEHGKA